MWTPGGRRAVLAAVVFEFVCYIAWTTDNECRDADCSDDWQLWDLGDLAFTVGPALVAVAVLYAVIAMLRKSLEQRN